MSALQDALGAGPALPVPQNRDLEEMLDMLAYILATDSRTSNINWILGDVGMGSPSLLPFGYISCFGERVQWMTANGGPASGGNTGLDDWAQQIVLTVAFAPHDFADPIAAAPPPSSALAPVDPLPYQEQPGFRRALQINQQVKGVLRQNIVVGGEAATTRVVESRYVLQVVKERLYRAARTTIQAQQRRVRGT